MSDAVATQKKAPRKPPQNSRIRRMNVRQLRERYAGFTPCSLTQTHILVERKARARQMLECFVPVLAEREDGTLDPRGYPASTAALLQVMDPNDEVEVLIRPLTATPAVNPLPLLLELNYRIDQSQLKNMATCLFSYWRACGAEKVSLEAIAKELSHSSTTYMRKVGWTYALHEAANECDIAPEVVTASDLFAADSDA